jgi:hypothetical protein
LEGMNLGMLTDSTLSRIGVLIIVFSWAWSFGWLGGWSGRWRWSCIQLDIHSNYRMQSRSDILGRPSLQRED